MAYNETPAASSGIWGAVKQALGVFDDVNKSNGVNENNSPLPEDPYESSYSDLEITELVAIWKSTYNKYYAEIDKGQKTSFAYWIGKHNMSEPDEVQGTQVLVDNKIFESIETFIPIATRSNPDPLVQADPSDIGQIMAHDIKQVLVHEAGRQKFRKILKRVLRDWIICRIGVLKVNYNINLEQIETTAINPKRMIFDKDGFINESGKFVGEYLGEKKKSTAGKLIKMFPKKKLEIMQKCQNKTATKMEYIEWWYRGTDTFYIMDDLVLGKYKNANWNYDIPEVPEIPGTPDITDPMTGQVIQPGQPPKPGIPPVEGKNHLKEPEAPYTFLSIFSTGLQPHDETSLILQNISIQDMINRRWRQLDRNVEGMNNGLVVGAVFTSEQASQAAAALRRGTAIRVPSGNVNEQVARFPAPPLPSEVFDMLRDGRDELRNIFGTSGSTPDAINREDTVRGKILSTQLDSSRIGGGITEYLEQVADTIYNWWVQLMFVHFTDAQYYIDAGATSGNEIIQIKNTNLALLKTLIITVKEGSLIPKDPMTQRNEAIDLWSAGAIDPITFYKRLDFSDANESAKQLLLWKMVEKGALPPQAYIPDFQAPGGMPGIPGQLPQQGVGGPAVNNIDASPNTQAPAVASPGAVGQQSQQLMQSVPV